MRANELILGITGASAVAYGVRFLQILKGMENWRVHLIVSQAARQNLALEGGPPVAEVLALADWVWEESDLAASIASGSYPVQGMVVLPCSMKSLAAVALGLNNNLIARAADVQLKERRKLVLCPRETPLNQVHLEHMLKVTQMGGVILPPMPAFYHQPKQVTDLMDHTIGKILDQFSIDHQLFQRWEKP